MSRPAQSTVRALSKVKQGISYRELAQILGYDDSIVGTLNDILKKGTVVSLEKENDLRRRLGLRLVTEGGTVVRERKIERPYVTRDQVERRDRLGASWRTIIDAGLAELEKRPKP